MISISVTMILPQGHIWESLMQIMQVEKYVLHKFTMLEMLTKNYLKRLYFSYMHTNIACSNDILYVHVVGSLLSILWHYTLPRVWSEGWSSRCATRRRPLSSVTLLWVSRSTLRVGVAFSALASNWQSTIVNSNKDQAKFIPQFWTLKEKKRWGWNM